MLRGSVILFLWAFIGVRIGVKLPVLADLCYSITLLISSFIVQHHFRIKYPHLLILSFFPFLFSIPMMFTDLVTLWRESQKQVADVMGILFFSIGILFPLLKTIRHDLRRTI